MAKSTQLNFGSWLPTIGSCAKSSLGIFVSPWLSGSSALVGEVSWDMSVRS